MSWKKILENQIDAITRAVALIGAGKKLAFNDITYALAKAEKDAKFTCGFEMLDSTSEVKKQLLENLIARNLVTVNKDGHIQLTLDGLERAKRKLPSAIEQHLAAKSL